MEPIGSDLRAIRESRKISLAQIAQATRISQNHLKNLEEGRYKSMPGGIYNRAFLRAYCEFLGLNPQEYLDRYGSETLPPSEKITKTKLKVPAQEKSAFISHPLLAWGLMLLFSVVGLYFSRHWISAVFSPYFSRSPVTRMPEPAPSPAQTQSQAPPKIQPTYDRPSVPLAEPGPDQQTSSGPAPAPNAASLNSKASAAPPPPGTMRIEFHVLEKCWVSVNSDGARVLVKLLEPGDDLFFDAMDRFYIILGNAGGVHVKINGKAAKPLGKPGEVVRVLINQQNMSEMLERTSG